MPAWSMGMDGSKLPEDYVMRTAAMSEGGLSMSLSPASAYFHRVRVRVRAEQYELTRSHDFVLEVVPASGLRVRMVLCLQGANDGHKERRRVNKAAAGGKSWAQGTD
eukprot:1149553-Pelagomonas_calceolata.AAC.4